jgi:hypothetical protein
MLKKIVLLCLIVGIGAMTVPAFAVSGVVGRVANVSTSDRDALGGSVAFRVWSTIDPNINTNTGGACLNARCPTAYLTAVALQPGGFGFSETTALYANDADNQTFYSLFDGQIGAGTANRAGYYAVQGIVASNGTATAPLGSPVNQGCTGTQAQNCMERADTRFSRAVPLTDTAVNFGGGPGAFSVRSIGGLSPVPHVKAVVGGACPAGQTCLTWDEPETYAGAMRAQLGNPAPPSPVKGVRVYKTTGPCTPGPTDATTWNLLADFPMGAGGTQHLDPLPPGGQCAWYALNVRLIGPGGGANELEPGRTGNTGFIGMNSRAVAQAGTAIHIVRVNARYAGRNTVNVSFTTGISGDVTEYYISRASSPAGPYTRVTESIGNLGDNHTYTISDKVRSNLGHSLFYQIEVVKTDGTSELSSPASVTLPAGKMKKLDPQ